MTNSLRLKLFCPQHQYPLTATRLLSEVVCDLGPHTVTPNFLTASWEFCCACQSFTPRDPHANVQPQCRCCDRAFTGRFLCAHCDTLTCETNAPTPQALFSLTSNGAPHPHCPCCLQTPTGALQLHECRKFAPFVTARRRCPFCGDALRQPPPETREIFPSGFYKRVNEYLSFKNGNAIAVGPLSEQPQILREQTSGPFWLLPHTNEQTFVVFPSVGQFQSGSDFAPYRQFFDCASPARGELWIHAPAVAVFDPELREWTLTQKGRLTVQAPELPSKPLPEPTFTTAPTNKLPDALPDDFATHSSVRSPGQPAVAASAPLTSNPFAQPEPSTTNKTPLLIGGGLAVLVVVIILLYVAFPSAKRQVLSKAKQGQLFTPAGESAYDIFQRTSFSASDLAELRKEMEPLLETRGEGALRRLYSDSSYDPSVAELTEHEQTFAWLTALTQQNNHQARRYYFRGRLDYEAQNYNDAEKNFRQSSQLDAGWAMPVNTLARVFIRRRDYTSAETCYLKAIELDPNWMFPRINLCTLQVNNLRKFSEAVSSCQGVLQLDNRKASGYFYLGQAYENLNNGCTALENYNQALAFASTNPGFNVTRLQEHVNRHGGRLCSH